MVHAWHFVTPMPQFFVNQMECQELSVIIIRWVHLKTLWKILQGVNRRFSYPNEGDMNWTSYLLAKIVGMLISNSQQPQNMLPPSLHPKGISVCLAYQISNIQFNSSYQKGKKKTNLFKKWSNNLQIENLTHPPFFLEK